MMNIYNDYFGAVLNIGAKLLPLPLAPGLNIRRPKTQHLLGGGWTTTNRQ